MPDLQEVLETSGLVTLICDADDDAKRYLRGKMQARHDNRPMWSWSETEGLQPVEPPDGGDRKLEAGSHAGMCVKALEQIQRLEEGVCLLVLGADQLKSSASLLNTLKHQVNQQITTAVLVSRTGRLGDMLKRVSNPSRLTVDIRGGNPAPPRAALSTVIGAELDIEEIGDLELFDSDGWTEYLHRLPAHKLQQICDSEIYRESVARVESLCEGLKNVFVDKDELILLMAWCSIAHLPLLLLGPWGTGKSMLVRQFSIGLGISPFQRRIATEDDVLHQMRMLAKVNGDGSEADARNAHDVLFADHSTRHFEYLVTRFTTPEELLGPINVDVMLSHAIHMRQTRSLMPRAEIVFLDEVFKANSSILNALLSIMNERLFYNAGMPWSVNMVMMFGASNEPPMEDDLGAFYDRFPVRVLCNPVPNERIEDLLQAAHAQEYLSLAAGDDLRPIDPDGKLDKLRMKQEACVNDFRLLRKVCLFKFGGLDIHHAKTKKFVGPYVDLFQELRDEYDVSDRSCAHFSRLARAKALLEKRDEMERDDCKVMYYCGKNPEAARRLPAIVDSVIS
jgi:MoxR-like ATPase